MKKRTTAINRQCQGDEHDRIGQEVAGRVAQPIREQLRLGGAELAVCVDGHAADVQEQRYAQKLERYGALLDDGCCS